jgi:hypothetical protein
MCPVFHRGLCTSLILMKNTAYVFALGSIFNNWDTLLF